MSWDEREEGFFFLEERTELESIWNTVEHVGIHVCVDEPVAAGVVASRNEEGVTLGDGNRLELDWSGFNVRLSETR